MGIKGLTDTFFISHGSPLLAIDDSIEIRKLLKSWKEEVFPQRPSSILVISGHWDTAVPTVNVVDNNETILDFEALPELMYQLTYPAPGAPELARRVKELLKQSGFSHIDEDKKRGLDHGAWVPLRLMYPEADIPVCQLSVQCNQNGTHHYNMGKALAPLKDEVVLVIGSGAAVHNFPELRLHPADAAVAPWVLNFDNWLKQALLQGRYEDVNRYEEKAPHAEMAHPMPDHFYPLHVAIGAAGGNSKAKLIHSNIGHGSLSYSSYQFTSSSS